MPKVKVMCNAVNGVAMVYGAPQRVLFGSQVNSADAIKTFTVPCGNDIEHLKHEWNATLEMLNLPPEYNGCTPNIIPALAKALLFNPDVRTEYKFNLQKTVRKDKCFAVKHLLFTVYEQYDIAIYPIDNQGNIIGKGKKFQVYKPVDKILQPEVQIEDPCCTTFDDLNALAFAAFEPAIDEQFTFDGLTEGEDSFTVKTDTSSAETERVRNAVPQEMVVRLPAEDFIVRREIFPVQKSTDSRRVSL